MANGEVQNAPAIEEAADQLGDSQDERQDDWSPNDLNEEQREQYDPAVKAVDEFVAKHPEYKPTDENRDAILDYLSQHDLAISPASLELVWEQIGDRLDLEPEPEDAEPPESEQEESKVADRVRQASIAQLGRTRSEEEPPETVEKEPGEEEPTGRRGKPVVAWRNGRAVSGVGS